MKQVCSQLTFETLPGLASRRKKQVLPISHFIGGEIFLLGVAETSTETETNLSDAKDFEIEKKHFSPRKLIVQAFTFVFDLSLGCIWNS